MELNINSRPARPIKRRRFDDDVMDENMDQIYHQRQLASQAEAAAAAAAALTVQSEEPEPPLDTNFTNVLPGHHRPLPEVNAPLPAAKKIHRSVADDESSVTGAAGAKGGGKRKKIKSTKRMKNRNQFINSIWRPEDDLLLIDAVIQTNDLNAVFCAVKFSTHFTVKEIQERWEALLYDSTVAQSSRDAISALPIDIRNRLLSRALFSEAEEQILMDVSSNKNLDFFRMLLRKHRNVFHRSRTAETLKRHWLLLKKYQLLSNQSIPTGGSPKDTETFSDMEERVIETAPAALDSPLITDPVLQNELSIADLRAKEEIKLLELEIPRWEFLLSQFTGDNVSQFDDKTLAVMRGKSQRYLIMEREITIGRSCKGHVVDIDLSLEGPASKVSRLQGMIKLLSCGAFFLYNCGKRPIFVDGQALLPAERCKLYENSILIICKLTFLFLINQEKISKIQLDTEANILSTASVTTASSTES